MEITPTFRFESNSISAALQPPEMPINFGKVCAEALAMNEPLDDPLFLSAALCETQQLLKTLLPNAPSDERQTLEQALQKNAAQRAAALHRSPYGPLLTAAVELGRRTHSDKIETWRLQGPSDVSCLARLYWPSQQSLLWTLDERRCVLNVVPADSATFESQSEPPSFVQYIVSIFTDEPPKTATSIEAFRIVKGPLLDVVLLLPDGFMSLRKKNVVVPNSWDT